VSVCRGAVLSTCTVPVCDCVTMRLVAGGWCRGGVRCSSLVLPNNNLQGGLPATFTALSGLTYACAPRYWLRYRCVCYRTIAAATRRALLRR
jgi:hypothetical protein